MVQTAITPYNDYYIQGTEISGSHFPLGAAFVLIFLTFGINPFIKKMHYRIQNDISSYVNHQYPIDD